MANKIALGVHGELYVHPLIKEIHILASKLSVYQQGNSYNFMLVQLEQLIVWLIYVQLDIIIQQTVLVLLKQCNYRTIQNNVEHLEIAQ